MSHKKNILDLKPKGEETKGEETPAADANGQGPVATLSVLPTEAEARAAAADMAPQFPAPTGQNPALQTALAKGVMTLAQAEAEMSADGPLKKLPENWRSFTAQGLGELCKRAGLPASGLRANLVKRLEVKFFSTSAKQVNGRMKCRYCQSQARVTATRKLNEEGTVIERYYACRGKRVHTFKVQETIEPDAAASDGEADATGAEPANMQRSRKKDSYL